MVRTYTFNPSTQSSLSTSLPALPPAAVFAHSASIRRHAAPAPAPPPPPQLLPHYPSAFPAPRHRHELPPPDPQSHNRNASNTSSSSGVGESQRFFQPVSVPAVPSSSVPVEAVAPLLALSTITNNGQSYQQKSQKFVVPPPGEGNSPWIRGNPQPKNDGQRGSLTWQEAFEAKTKAHFGATFGRESAGGWIEKAKAADQERHQMELLAQVEANRQQRIRERQRDWQMEERERIKDELYQQRMQMELEEERRREREKALLVELKMAKLAAAQRATEETLRAAKNGENPRGKGAPRGQPVPSDLFDSNGTATKQRQRQRSLDDRTTEEGDQLEWWERKDRRKEMEEANGRGEIIPAFSGGARGRRAASGDSRRSDGSAGSRGHTRRPNGGNGAKVMRTGYTGYGGAHRVAQGQMHTDDLLTINIGGKKYMVRRSNLLADPRSKLADWFRPGTTRVIATDKGGNFFLDRDPKAFRHILGYLRLKKERCVASLVGECESLNLVELREMALEMLQKYVRTEEQHFVTSYVQMALRDYDAWQFEQEQASEATESERLEKGAFPNLQTKNEAGETTELHHLSNNFEQKSVYDEWVG
uniref:BTB_2 domain-containing protein n=1 Tax=Globodera pallida TaxID=36090 RepID=A0A183C971_GLOPA